jgi:uncharacterized protein YciI
VPVFHVQRSRNGPQWRAGVPLEAQAGWTEHAAFMDDLVARGRILLGGPLADDHRVILVLSVESEAAVHELLAQDPWSGSHLSTDEVARWTIRLDGREPR